MPQTESSRVFGPRPEKVAFCRTALRVLAYCAQSIDAIPLLEEMRHPVVLAAVQPQIQDLTKATDEHYWF